MALVLKDRVRETSTTTGTGTFTLAGAVAGFQSFSAIGTGNSTYYTIVSTSDWEVGIGTWTSPDQLSRDTVLASTNAGALVTFGSGTKDVFLTFPAEGFAVPPAIGGTTPNTITSAGIFTSVSNDYSFIGSTTGNTQLTLSDAGYTDITANLYIDDAFQAPAFFSKDASNNFLPFYFFAGTGLIDPSGAGVTLKAATSGNWTLTFPTTAGSANRVLTTDGSGNLSWSIGGGSSYYRNNATTNTLSGTAVAAGSFVVGTAYSIVTLGTTNWNTAGYVGTAAAGGIFVAQAAGSGTGTATPLLSASGVANGVTLSANTIYQIEGECYMSSTGTTSHTMTAGLKFSGGLTMSDMFVSIQRFGSSSTPTTTVANNFTTGTGNPSTSAIVTTSGVMLYISYAVATATYNSYRFSGTIAIGTGGSLNPVFAYTTASPGGTLTANPKSWFKATPIGTTGSNVSIGTWT